VGLSERHKRDIPIMKGFNEEDKKEKDYMYIDGEAIEHNVYVNKLNISMLLISSLYFYCH
jgi:hypothetical protein